MDPANDGFKCTNTPHPKNREIAIMWELQVLKALDLPLAELMWKMLERLKPYETKMVSLDT
jgi:hypothetical protein